MRLPIKQKEVIKVGISINQCNVNYIMIRKKQKQVGIMSKGKLSADNIVLALNKIKREVKNYPCYLALPHREFSVKTLDIGSAMREKEIIQFLNLNANHYFSYPLEMLHYDFEFLKRSQNQVRILASKKEYVKRWQAEFNKAGLLLH